MVAELRKGQELADVLSNMVGKDVRHGLWNDGSHHQGHIASCRCVSPWCSFRVRTFRIFAGVLAITKCSYEHH